MATRLVVPTGGVSTGDCTSTACTVARGINQAVAGDTVEFAAGTYAGAFGDNGIIDLFGKNGSNGNPIVLRPATDATVIIKPDATTYRAIYFRNCSWIELRDMVVDGTNLTGEAIKLTDSTNGATDILIQGCEITAAPTMGILTSGTLSTNITIRDCVIHNGGTNLSLDHALYIATPNTIIDGCETYAWAAHGIQLYGNSTMDNFTLKNCYIHDGNAGVGIYGADGHKIYNNVIVNNSSVGIQLRPYEAMDNVLVANNTIYGNDNIGILFNDVGPQAMTNIAGTNNISYGNSGTQISNVNSVATLTTNLTTDPLFINPASNWRLQSSSAAKNAGTNLAGTFTTDKDGISRPQGSAWDIGAYEYVDQTAIRLAYRLG